MTMTSIQTNSVTELVIVDGALPDVDVLVQGVHDRAAVFVLDPSTDGLAQMAAIAARYTGLAAIHVVSHGSAGSLQLGTTQLDAGSLQSHHTSLATLGASLSGEGDLLFYGCNVAQGPVGRTFIDAVALATGADVAASTDLTGASFLGGNWQLEAGTGSIEAGSLAIVRYAQTLESPDVLASTSTTATLPLSGSVSGTVGSSGDQDWYRVTLTGGVSYRIEQEKLNGSTNGLADTYLRLFNAAGAQIADNDDIAGAANRNSRVLYTPASTGVVYVSAGAFGNNLGDYSVRVLQVNTLASSGNDTLTGTANNDFLDGGDGDDLLNRGAGDDVLSGGGGRDTLAGGDGDDTLDGGIAADSMNGGDGNDTYYVDDVGDVAAESWNDSIGGVDTVYSTATSHTLGFGIEHLVLTGFLNANGVGNANANALTGNSADNALSGGAGSDTLAGGNGSDTLDGGDGVDRASYAQSTSPVTVSLAVTGTQNTGGSGSHRLLNIEELEGGSADDSLGGDGQANLLLGLAGNDTLDGGGGNDTLDGGSGQDTATYASAPGAVRVSLAIAGPQDTGAAGLDTLVSIEELQGGAFDDTLTGGSGSDTLRGGAGNDTLVGGPGNDSLDGGDGTQDRVSYANASVGLTVGLGGNWNLGALGTDILVNIEQLEGSNFDDFLVGTDADDWYLGGLGNDTLFGGLGNDTLDGGSGTQDQAIYDNATGGVTVNLRLGGAQDTGNAGFDTLLRIEYLTGGAFNDLLIGDDGDNRLEGLGGNDTLEGGLGNDTLDGGAGFDIASFASAFGVYVWLDDPNPHFTGAGIDTLLSIEGLEGSQYADELRGNSGDNRLSGLGGDDTLGGGGGFDTLLGGDGNDVLDGTGFGASTLVGGDGNDIYFVDSTDDFVDESGSNGYDIVRTFASISLTDGIEEVNYFGADGGGITGNNQDNLMTGFANGMTLDGRGGNDTLEAGSGNDFLFGGTGDDSLDGSLGSDVLSGDTGNDTLDGGDGSDNMAGGLGADEYHVDNQGDVVTELNNDPGSLHIGLGLGSAIDKVIASISYALSQFVENLTLLDAATALTGTGNAEKNLLLGNSFNNTLTGNAGDDTLDGAGGNDTLLGGAGNDSLLGDVGFDSLDGGDGLDNLNGGINADTLAGGLGNDFLSGGKGTDNLNGGEGDDTLVGGLGTDLLTGGPGADHFVFRNPLDGTSNIDTFTDFAAGVDVIELSASIFAAFSGQVGVRIAPGGNLGYNPVTGVLAYDADGAGAGQPITFAIMGTSTHPASMSNDFLIVA